MPITQERMLELIEAAHDYEECWNRTRETMKAQQEAVTDGLITEGDAFYRLIEQLSMIYPQPASTRAIATEEKHFKILRSRNILRRQYMRDKRAGIDPLLKARPSEVLANMRAQQNSMIQTAEEKELFDRLVEQASKKVDEKTTPPAEVPLDNSGIIEFGEMPEEEIIDPYNQQLTKAIEEEIKATENLTIEELEAINPQIGKQK